MSRVVLGRSIKAQAQANPQGNSAKRFLGSTAPVYRVSRPEVLLHRRNRPNVNTQSVNSFTSSGQSQSPAKNQSAKSSLDPTQVQTVGQTQKPVQNQVASQDQNPVGLPISGKIRSVSEDQRRINLRNNDSTKSMSLQVKYDDIELVRQYESGGDDPSLQTFKMRVRVDGTGSGFSNAKGEVVSTPGEVIYNTPSAKRARVPEEARIIKFDGNNDYSLRVFDPDSFWKGGKNYNYLQADIAIGGAIAWDSDAYTVAGGIENRQIFTDSLVELARSSTHDIVGKFSMQFDYRSYMSPFNDRPSSEWIQDLGDALGRGLDAVTGYASGTLSNLLYSVIADRLSFWNGYDEVIGVHLFVLIPTTAKFYNQLNRAKENNYALSKMFPYQDLINTVSFSDNPGNKIVKPSLDITYGFVPASNPLAKSESTPYRRPMGEERTLNWRGGFEYMSRNFNSVHWAGRMPEIDAHLI